MTKMNQTEILALAEKHGALKHIFKRGETSFEFLPEELISFAAALTGSVPDAKPALHALKLNGEIADRWVTDAGMSAAEGMRDNFISLTRPCDLPTIEIVPLYAAPAAQTAAITNNNALRKDHPMAKGKCAHGTAMSDNCASCARPTDRFGAVELILRDVCEADPADPVMNDTICIDISDLSRILKRHIAPELAAQAERPEPAAWMDARQFLADVHTAAGMVEHGKQSKALAERLGNGCMKFYPVLSAPAAPGPAEPVAPPVRAWEVRWSATSNEPPDINPWMALTAGEYRPNPCRDEHALVRLSDAIAALAAKGQA